jgi:hypothetical protein
MLVLWWKWAVSNVAMTSLLIFITWRILLIDNFFSSKLRKKEQLDGLHKTKLQQSLTYFPMFIFLEPLCSVLTSTILLQKLAVIHLVYKCNGMMSCSSYVYPHAVLKNFFFSEHYRFPCSHVCTVYVRNMTHFKCNVNPPPPTNTHTQNQKTKRNNFWKLNYISLLPCKKKTCFFQIKCHNNPDKPYFQSYFCNTMSVVTGIPYWHSTSKAHFTSYTIISHKTGWKRLISICRMLGTHHIIMDYR